MKKLESVIQDKPNTSEVEYGNPHIFPFKLGKKRYVITNGLPDTANVEPANHTALELVVQGNADTLLSDYLTNHYDRKHARKLAGLLSERFVEIDETALHSIALDFQNKLSESPWLSLISALKDLYDKKELSQEFNLLTGLVPPHKVDQLRNAFNFDHLFKQTNEVKIYSLSPKSNGKLLISQ